MTTTCRLNKMNGTSSSSSVDLGAQWDGAPKDNGMIRFAFSFRVICHYYLNS